MKEKTLTLGSLFDGSGSFPLGGVLAGITPVWNSEIEPFPVLVTHKRLPAVKHYGDVSQLSGAELEPVDVITFGSPCFPEGTLVLTEEGYIPIEDVEVGMKVLTHTGRWRTVTAAGAKFGETVLLKGNHYGLECTPNHPIYSSGEKKYYPQLGNGRRGCRLHLTDEKSWIPASEMKGKLWAVPNSVEALPISSPVYSGSRREKAMPPMTEDLFYFIGRWLGDGWVRDSQRSGRPNGQRYGTIILCDSYDKEDELRRTVEKLTDNYHVEHDGTVVKFKFTSQVFCEWLTDNFGREAFGKTMPGWVFGLPKAFRKSLLNGLLDSDGCHVKGKDNTWKVSTVSKKLAESIRLLAEIQGYSTTVHKTEVEEKKLIEGRLVHQRDWYSVVITMNGTRNHLSDEFHGWYRVRSVEPTNRNTVVYNLTVDEDNSYVADGIVVHNCQDLSIAGKRAGIHDGERSNLFFQAIRIIKEMREKTNGKYPRYCVWENVPGAFSSNGGDDFKAVLEAVISVKEDGVEVPAPENHRWPKADVYLGDGWSLAYRVLDAQYWGVPQRRARIYLVADFAGGSAPEILFKSEGLSGYTPQGFRSWQGTAGSAEEGPGEAGERTDAGSGDRVTYCMNPQGNSGVGITEDKTLALVAQDHGNHPSVLQSAGFSTEHSAKSRSIGYEEEVSPTLRAGVVPAAMAIENYPTDSRVKIVEDGKVQTLTERMGTGGGNVPLVAEPEPVTLKIRGGRPGGGKGPLLTHGKSATLGTNNDQTLFQPVEGKPDSSACSEMTPEIRAFGVCSKASHSMMSDNPHSGFYEAETSRTLDCNGGRPDCGQGGICVVAPDPETYDVRFTSDGSRVTRGHVYPTETARTLSTDKPDPAGNQGGIAVVERDPAYALQGSMIGRDVKNGPQGDGVNEDVSFTLNTVDRHAVAFCEKAYGIDRAAYNQGKNAKFGFAVEEELEPTLVAKGPGAVAHPENGKAPTYSANKASFFTSAMEEKAGALVATDYKDPPLVNDKPCGFFPQMKAEGVSVTEEKSGCLVNGTNPGYQNGVIEPDYIVRRLTPTECARLQGFPDWWCEGLEIPDPSDEEISFWTEVWETWRKITNPEGKPKTEKQIRKWLASPYTDASEYKLWGNGCCLPIVYFVLSGIAWACNKDSLNKVSQ